MARKKTGHDPNQLQLGLWSNFKTKGEELKRAMDAFAQAAEEVAGAHDNPETPAVVNDEVKATRVAINRIIRILASQTGLPHRTLWVLAYHELHDRTGVHAVAESGGRGVHLDTVENAGKLPELHETVVGMLTDPKFKPPKSNG